MLKRLWLNLRKLFLLFRWVFGYRAVFSREPSIKSLVLYAKMGRAVATKYCVVCKKEYWVIGNPKIKGHFSVTCGSRKCYLEYNLNKRKFKPQISIDNYVKRKRGSSRNKVDKSYTRPVYKES